jgi:hypothetical protein
VRHWGSFLPFVEAALLLSFISFPWSLGRYSFELSFDKGMWQKIGESKARQGKARQDETVKNGVWCRPNRSLVLSGAVVMVRLLSWSFGREAFMHRP